MVGIDEQAWTPIPHWSSDFGAFGYHVNGGTISGADGAALGYVAHAGSPDAVKVRLAPIRAQHTSR